MAALFGMQQRFTSFLLVLLQIQAVWLSLVFIDATSSPISASSSTTHDVDSYEFPVCIVGAGLSGAVLAERYATMLNKKVWIIDKRDHIGGNCYDYIDEETNIRVSKYGAHLFHTSKGHVQKYIQQFGRWKEYRHQVRSLVKDDKYVPIPVNIETVNTLFDLNMTTSVEMKDWLRKERRQSQMQVGAGAGTETGTETNRPQNSKEMALSRVGPRLYEILFRPYTYKQWNQDPSELSPDVLARIPIYPDHRDAYFTDVYQAQPIDGFTSIFEELLSSSSNNIQLNLQTDFFDVRSTMMHSCGRIYYTGPIDAYFASLGLPRLQYRSLVFEKVVVDTTTPYGTYQPYFVVNHPNPKLNYTRIVEYKHLMMHLSGDGGNTSNVGNTSLFVNKTIYVKERSSDDGEPFYPVPNARNQALYQQYQQLAAQEEKVSFVGRLANYKYFNMDEAIENALALFEKDTAELQ